MQLLYNNGSRIIGSEILSWIKNRIQFGSVFVRKKKFFFDKKNLTIYFVKCTTYLHACVWAGVHVLLVYIPAP